MIKNKYRKTGDPGFSLVELLILLAMIAILSAFAVPALSTSLSNMQLSADARNISSTLTYARISATSLMNPYRLTFDIANNQWRLLKFNRTNSQYELLQDVNGLSSGLAGSGIAFKTSSSSHPMGFPAISSTAITFNSRGIPVDVSGVPTTNNIIYISKSDNDYAITVSLTGTVQVWKKNDSGWDVR